MFCGAPWPRSGYSYRAEERLLQTCCGCLCGSAGIDFLSWMSSRRQSNLFQRHPKLSTKPYLLYQGPIRLLLDDSEGRRGVVFQLSFCDTGHSFLSTKNNKNKCRVSITCRYALNSNKRRKASFFPTSVGKTRSRHFVSSKMTHPLTEY